MTDSIANMFWKSSKGDKHEDAASIMSGMSGTTLAVDTVSKGKGGKRSLLKKLLYGGKEEVEDEKQ